VKSGFVSIIGRPNVGKSTLINKVINQKIAITSDKVGTTRNIIYGIYNDDDSQIIFVDTPGIQKAQNKLETVLNSKSYTSISDNDLILFIVDIASGFGPNDMKILDIIKGFNKPVFLILNKIDLINKQKLIKEIDKLRKLHDFKEIIPISSLKDKDVFDLIKSIKKYLTSDIKYFMDDEVTNVSPNFMIGEIIREKVLNLTREEVPHAVTCLVEKITKKKNIYHINALIIVERDNLKNIIIGKHGSMLKEIGTLARKELEEYLNCKIYLELYVKTIKDWRNKEQSIKDLGLNELNS